MKGATGACPRCPKGKEDAQKAKMMPQKANEEWPDSQKKKEEGVRSTDKGLAKQSMQPTTRLQEERCWRREPKGSLTS